jgi:D(-)-tartrate dehydratase
MLADATGENLDPHAAWRVMMSNEKPGGHGERSVAVGTLDMAIWDAVAKIDGRPLYRVLADRYNNGQADPDVYVYAAGGYYYPGKDYNALRQEMQAYLAMGYTTVKMKIGGASLDEDIARIEAVLSILPAGADLAVDANGRFERAAALEYARALSGYPLKWYEEPGDPLDFELNAAVASESRVPIATGENLFSVQDSRNLLRYGGMNPERDYLQMDPALSYGTVEYLRILDALREHGWSARRCIPHGGHQMALQIAAGLGLGGNESYPGIFQPFGGFADGVPVRNSRVTIPDAPGIGIEEKAALMDIYRTL